MIMITVCKSIIMICLYKRYANYLNQNFDHNTQYNHLLSKYGIKKFDKKKSKMKLLVGSQVGASNNSFFNKLNTKVTAKEKYSVER